MKRFSTIILASVIIFGFLKKSYAQSSLLTDGIIYYQKKINNHAQFKLMFDPETPQGKKMTDSFTNLTEQFETFDFSLRYFNNQTFYKPEGYFESKNILNEITAKNTVYTDFDQNISTSSITLFDKSFIIDDPIRPIKWKLTEETRNIAGFDCRRANGLTADSIYVVAFYTENIATMGGPEHFHGLPGMILGVALPHDHISWFATRIEKNNSSAPIKEQLTGSKINRDEVVVLMKKLIGSKIKIRQEVFDRIFY